MGGSRAGTARVARAARTGGAALAGVARAGAGLPPVAGALDVRTLAGLTVNLAIDRIVDAFCPPGILDEDVARLAVGEALATALSGIDTFDPSALDANSVRVATLAFVGELVFVQIAGDGGKSLAAAPSPTAAAVREAALRSLVHEVADLVGTPILEAAGNLLPLMQWQLSLLGWFKPWRRRCLLGSNSNISNSQRGACNSSPSSRRCWYSAVQYG